jgi:Domain of unknown function (DUF4372)
LAQAKSLREITEGLQASEGKLKHLGLPEAGLPGTPLGSTALALITLRTLRRGGNAFLEPMIGEGAQQLWNLPVTLDAAEFALCQ